MKSALLDSPLSNPRFPAQNGEKENERQLTIDQLARAVGEHALLQVEVDQRMATRILQLRDELGLAKEEIRSLQTQLDQLIRGLSQGFELACSRSAHAAQHTLQASAASLRNR